MKVIVIISFLLIGNLCFGQCPEWLTSISNSYPIIKNADSVWNTKFNPILHKPGGYWYFKDTSSKYIRIDADDSMKNVKQITINSFRDDAEKLFVSMIQLLPSECIIEKRKQYIMTNNFEFDIFFDQFDPKTKKQKAIITITRPKGM